MRKLCVHFYVRPFNYEVVFIDNCIDVALAGKVKCTTNESNNSFCVDLVCKLRIRMPGDAESIFQFYSEE